MKKGFTLIELLVVIAIVGILAAVTLAILNDARDRARDSQVKGTMEQMRKQGEIYYSINGNYGNDFLGFCLAAVNSNDLLIFNDNVSESLHPLLIEVMGLLNDNQSSGGVDVACRARPAPVAERWAVRVPLPSNDAPWCVDSTGYAGPASTITGNAVCVPL